MTQFFSRTNRSPLAQWWWTIDRPMVLGVLALLAFGYLMAFAASPAVAQHIDKSIYFFARSNLSFSHWRCSFSSSSHVACQSHQCLPWSC